MNDTHYECECPSMLDHHPVTSDDEWMSLSAFRDLFQINGYIVNKDCPGLPDDIDPDLIHAETLHMMLIERT